MHRKPCLISWLGKLTNQYSLGYSKKGWTDGEIGVAWIEQFDKETSKKANGEYQLLLVDGHNSHYTHSFLEYARTHQILVLCYPSHTTHIYQGLDVVIFSVLKRHWSEAHDEWKKKTGQLISKTNFLAVYGTAHIKALTQDNILAAFRKTGVWPFNPNVVTKDMLATSKETLCQGSLPTTPPTPIKLVATLLQDLSLNEDLHLTTIEEAPEAFNSDTTSVTPTVTPANNNNTHESLQTRINELIAKLSQTQIADLVSDKPLSSSVQMPSAAVGNIQSMAGTTTDISKIEPKTKKRNTPSCSASIGRRALQVLPKSCHHLAGTGHLD